MQNPAANRLPRSLIIGQRLSSGGSGAVAAAILSRDTAVIARIALEQARAGADYLDVNAAAWGEAAEPEALRWLIETVQEAVDLPLCLDSVNPIALRFVLPLCCRPPLLNCFSGAVPNTEGMRALLGDYGHLPVVAACYDWRGSQTEAGQRLEIAEQLAGALRVLGVGEIIWDPVTLPASCGPDALAVTLATMRGLRRQWPHARILGVPSNYSYGLESYGLESYGLESYGLARRRSAEWEYAKQAHDAGANVFLCNVYDSVLRRRLGE